MAIRILLADDHQILREGLRALLSSERDMEVVGEAADGRSAVQLAADLAPDVVIMDVAMPDLNGVEATRQITQSAPGAKVIALSMHSDKRFVQEMLRAGACGYVRKGSSISELARAIHNVVKGHVYLCPTAADIVARGYVDQLPAYGSPPAVALTPREREVAQLLAEGMIPKQIAAELGISVKTVSTHRRHVMVKCGLQSTADLVRYAIQRGYTFLET
ncbi:MAG: response regulator transcription factor [Planctomycetota bacterium]|jgi:DNA-binding NarL/FixJ family response regulator